MTTIIPLADRVVVRPLERDPLPSGLVLPEILQEVPQQGEVVAVGAGRRNKRGKRLRIDLSAGDRVAYRRYTGQEVEIDGERLIVLEEQYVLARIVR